MQKPAHGATPNRGRLAVRSTLIGCCSSRKTFDRLSTRVRVGQQHSPWAYPPQVNSATHLGAGG